MVEQEAALLSIPHTHFTKVKMQVLTIVSNFKEMVSCKAVVSRLYAQLHNAGLSCLDPFLIRRRAAVTLVVTRPLLSQPKTRHFAQDLAHCRTDSFAFTVASKAEQGMGFSSTLWY